MARWVARRMLSRSISSGEAAATHQVQPGVERIVPARRSRARAVSFFESVMSFQAPASSASASASGTVTAAA